MNVFLEMEILEENLFNKTINESINSNINKNHIGKEKLYLNKFNKIDLNNNSINKYKPTCKSLRHIRTGKGYKGLLYLDDENVVGFVNVNTITNTIQALEITNNYKQHKLSEQLLDVSIKELNADNLSVNKNNEVAIYLYKKKGFKVYKEDDTMLYMKLSNSKIN